MQRKLSKKVLLEMHSTLGYGKHRELALNILFGFLEHPPDLHQWRAKTTFPRIPYCQAFLNSMTMSVPEKEWGKGQSRTSRGCVFGIKSRESTIYLQSWKLFEVAGLYNEK